MASEPFLDEEYASEEDSDFAPDTAPIEDASEDSELEETATVQPLEQPKRKRAENDATDDFENSGDEAVIQKGKKRQKKAKRKENDLDEDGGNGGLVKTRSMRAVGKAERKSHAVTGPVTIDVDDVWAKMVAGPLMPSKVDEEKENEESAQEENPPEAREQGHAQMHKPTELELPAMIKIKRTYNFAGKVHTEEKLVPRDSAEAKLYLASQDPKSVDEAVEEDEAHKRKPRKAFRSVFEPMLEGMMQRSDLNLNMSMRLHLREQAKDAKAKKLNVVEKSRMDWAGFVDQEGIKDELELAGKSKESYTHRQDFLARVEAKKDEEARRARIAGRG
ncbi:bucentaur or craniofacial development-domain-containing protein [Xylariaceae sp. FL0016]|nr:bucentaur or craniofacial development-domain-containing protein [Xylariaceae sp. FL0016]